MAGRTTPDKGKGKDDGPGPLGDLGEVKDLVVAYAKQETIDPLKSLARYLIWGLVGSVLIAIGGGLLVLAAVRAAQSEAGRHLSGSLTWVPYVGGLIVALTIAGLALSRMTGGGSK